ncbi:GDSL esterase/lipase [Rhynchospora pubera]|uniref:GDSL esterase/lipase n=1 Tax=Rhynchospora pubera TaxID=906938 RepID=A0AAV8DE39_9POAL|nr:GDSL esterase/lipase [Rhynchospora pubera]
MQIKAQKNSLLLLTKITTILFYTWIAETEGKVPALIVFGDSTVDSGNNNVLLTALKANFPPYGRDFMGSGKPTGRFSNGRVATDFYSEMYGLRPFVPAYLDPEYNIGDFAVGVCFASAGTGIDPATAGVLYDPFIRRRRHLLCALLCNSVIPLLKQVELFEEYQARLAGYLGSEMAKQTISEGVYAISIGTNDFIENYFALATPRFLEFTPESYVEFLISLSRDFIIQIYMLGARKIGFTGLSGMGCLPLERNRNPMWGRPCIEEYNKVAREFNSKLQQMTDELCKALPDLQLRVAHLFDFFSNILENPSLYGFEDAQYGCCGTGTFELGYLCNEYTPFTCTDASKYVFWDAVHPTEKTSRIVAEFLMNTTFSKFK